jgi:hypothetical protein
MFLIDLEEPVVFIGFTVQRRTLTAVLTKVYFSGGTGSTLQPIPLLALTLLCAVFLNALARLKTALVDQTLSN